jgi:hypothetical protein
MVKGKWLKVRLSDEEFAKLKAHSGLKGWSMSLVIREYIKRLPSPKD